MAHAYYADAENKSKRRIRKWYQEHLMPALLANKERQARGADASIALTNELLARTGNVLIKQCLVNNVISSIIQMNDFPLPVDERGILDEKAAVPAVIPPHEIESRGNDDSLMMPIEPEVLSLLYDSTEKGAGEKYLKARNKKAPEDKFYFRIATNWDYGWQQKQSRMRARDVNRGRCAILRETFYRRNNLAPDPRHYSQPSGGEISICSEYSCNFT